MKCWATELLGGCQGGWSGEHYVSKKLFSGPTLTIKGMHFCPPEGLDIPLAKATANILCKRHNELLSPVDQEITHLKRALQELTQQPDPSHNTDRRAGPTQQFTVSGHRLTRWICKTACNVLTMNSRPLPESFIRYAFDDPAASPLYSYTVAHAGFEMGFDFQRLQLWDFYREHDRKLNFYICFFGLHWLVSEVDLQETPKIQFHDIGHVDTSELLREPKELSFVPTGSLIIKWPQRP